MNQLLAKGTAANRCAGFLLFSLVMLDERSTVRFLVKIDTNSKPLC